MQELDRQEREGQTPDRSIEHRESIEEDTHRGDASKKVSRLLRSVESMFRRKDIIGPSGGFLTSLVRNLLRSHYGSKDKIAVALASLVFPKRFGKRPYRPS